MFSFVPSVLNFTFRIFLEIEVQDILASFFFNGTFLLTVI